MELGAIIKNLRTDKHMTQSEFAERLGVTKSAVSAYENGSRLPSYDVLIKMARIFKVSTDTLLGQTDKNNITLDVTGLTKEQIDSIQNSVRLYREFNIIATLMPEEVKKQVQRFAETGKFE